MGASLIERKFPNISEDLVTEFTVNQGPKIAGGPMQGGYSTSIETVDVSFSIGMY